MIAAAPLAQAIVSPMLGIVPAAAPDPVADAYDRLVDATLDFERAGDAELYTGLSGWVDATLGLRRRLVAAGGEEVGGAVWNAAMDRHRPWLGDRYGLDESDGAVA